MKDMESQGKWFGFPLLAFHFQQSNHHVQGGSKCYIVGLGPNCKFIDLLFKRLVITFIKISFLNCFIVSEIIYSQTDTLTEELMYLR